MNAITSLRSNGTQTGAREITKDIDEQPKKLSDGEAVRERTNQTRARKLRPVTSCRRPISAAVNTFAVRAAKPCANARTRPTRESN